MNQTEISVETKGLCSSDDKCLELESLFEKINKFSDASGEGQHTTLETRDPKISTDPNRVSTKGIDVRILEMTHGTETQALVQEASGDNVLVESTSGMDFIQAYERRNSTHTVLSHSMDNIVNDIHPLPEQNPCIGELRHQIDDLEMVQLSLASEIHILESDREALLRNCPHPHWLTIFDRTNTSPHIGSNEDQLLLDDMEECPSQGHLSRKDLTLQMIDRLIQVRRFKFATTVRCIHTRQEQLNTLEVSLGVRATASETKSK